MISPDQILPVKPLPSASSQPNYSTIISGQSLPVFDNDTLRLDVYTLLAGLGGGVVAIRLSYVERVWRGVNDYDYVINQKDFVLPNVNGLINRFVLPLTRGELVSVAVQLMPVATIQYGDCFIRCTVVRAYGTTLAPIHALIQDYVTSLGYVTWPGGSIISAPDKPGCLVNVDLTPAAGAEVNTLVPDNSMWLVKQAAVNFTAAGGGVVRQPNIYFNDPAGNTVRSYESVDGVGAGVSLTIFFQPGSQVGTDTVAPLAIRNGSLFSNEQNVAGGFRSRIDFAPFLIRSGWRIFTNTPNIAAGDQWTFQVSIERWTFPNVNTP